MGQVFSAGPGRPDPGGMATWPPPAAFQLLLGELDNAQGGAPSVGGGSAVGQPAGVPGSGSFVGPGAGGCSGPRSGSARRDGVRASPAGAAPLPTVCRSGR